ncbi:MAG: phytanoyl-CoA dioxygenase family protein [Chloroflexi bacterium]|nr:phytanoyl-CoA dioxygenase family protein [Chloroflexota bacterium]
MPALTSEQKEHFNEYGFVRIEDVFDSENEIDPVVAEYADVLDSLAEKLFREEKISSTYSELSFGDRVTKIYGESGEIHNQYFDFSLPQNGVKPDTPFWAGPAVFRALTAPGVLDIAESIVGSEVYSNPVQHVRIKVPEAVSPRDEHGNVMFGATPWHQDAGVVNPEADETNILTVWFPLMDASAENGCLAIVPGSHRGELLTHCPGYKERPGLQIPEHLFNIGDSMPVPVKKGGALLLTKKTVHAALPNISDRIRWSFDLRYQPTGEATGRSVFPGFVARSASRPETELHDADIWYQMWKDTRDSLARGEQPTFNRWDADDPSCA